MKKKIITTLLLASMNIVHADTMNANFDTSSTLQPSCILSVSDLNFGTFTPDLTNTITSTKFNMTCTKGTPYVIKLNAGNGTFAQRYMKSDNPDNTDKLFYNAYSTPLIATTYGDGSPGTSVVNGTGLGVQISRIIYGRMYKNQFITPDNYSDTLTLVIEY